MVPVRTGCSPLFKYFTCIFVTNISHRVLCGVWFWDFVAKATMLAPAGEAGCKDYVLLSSLRLWYGPMAVEVMPVGKLVDTTKTQHQLHNCFDGQLKTAHIVHEYDLGTVQPNRAMTYPHKSLPINLSPQISPYKSLVSRAFPHVHTKCKCIWANCMVVQRPMTQTCYGHSARRWLAGVFIKLTHWPKLLGGQIW